MLIVRNFVCKFKTEYTVAIDMYGVINDLESQNAKFLIL